MATDFALVAIGGTGNRGDRQVVDPLLQYRKLLGGTVIGGTGNLWGQAIGGQANYSIAKRGTGKVITRLRGFQHLAVKRYEKISMDSDSVVLQAGNMPNILR